MVLDTRTARVAAAGDVLVVLAVMVAGLLRHDTSPIGAPLDAAEVLVPFLFGWLVLAGLLDLYRDARLRDLSTSLRFVVAAWLGTACIGLVIRTAPAIEGGVTWPFGLVVIGTGLLGLVPWRIVVARGLLPIE